MAEPTSTNPTTTPNQTQPAPDAVKPEEHMVPKSRLDEVLKAKKEMEDRLLAIEKAQKESEEKRMIEQQKYQELAETRQKEIEALRPKAAIAEESEKTLTSVLTVQISEIPESLRQLVPDQLTTIQKLEWIAKNKAVLLKPKGPDLGGGRQGGSAPSTADLAPEEIETAKRYGMTPEEYAKYKQ